MGVRVGCRIETRVGVRVRVDVIFVGRVGAQGWV